MFPKVTQVIPTEDYFVYVYFEDGKITKFNARGLLDTPAFKRLSDINFFLNACTVMNDTLAWDISGTLDETQCLDIDPFTLYELPMTVDLIA